MNDPIDIAADSPADARYIAAAILARVATMTAPGVANGARAIGPQHERMRALAHRIIRDADSRSVMESAARAPVQS